MDDVLIIGGGFAGLAAGVALAGAGKRVRLLEQKPYLGGRARSFYHAPASATVDNGQHIFMGCYHETLRFLRTIGTEDRVRFQTRLEVQFAEKHKGATSLRCPSLPSPWHLLAGVLKSNSFSLSEKFEVLSLRRRLSGADSGESSKQLGEITVDAWMARLGQSEKLRRNFWDLLCIAALNENSRIAAASVFEPVLRLALFRSAADSRIGLAATGLSDCYTEAAAAFIRARGGAIETGRGVAGFLFSPTEGLVSAGGGELECRGVRLANGSEIPADVVLCAIPCFELARLLPQDVVRSEPFFSSVSVMKPSPIISLNLWMDRAITDFDFVGLRGTVVQWLFNKGKILGSDGGYVSLVISGAHEHIHREKDELLALARGELRELFPRAREAKVVHSLVVKERFATFSPAVDVAALRPSAVTPIRGFYLAGDWTATGLPATIESAVKSGYTAASAIMRKDDAL
ncbi:MAG: hydroxysqualene dehydroxylase HpnE [Terriglobia bacterium]